MEKAERVRSRLIALFVFGLACAMTFSKVSAQVATFTTQQYPLLGNTHIAADLNADGRPRSRRSGRQCSVGHVGEWRWNVPRENRFSCRNFRRRRWPRVISTATHKVDLVVTLDSPSVQPRTAHRYRQGHLQRTDFLPEHFRIRFTCYCGDGSQWRRQTRSGGDAYHCLFHRAMPCRA